MENECMNRLRTAPYILVVLLLMAACGSQADPTLAIPEETSGPIPSIEILAGPQDSCAMADTTQSTVIGFEVDYQKMGTDAYMVGVMCAPSVGVIGEVEAEGEGRDGEESWGIYPEFYDLPPNTAITLEITVYNGADESAPVSSTSRLTYDCSTGEKISASFNVTGK